MNRPGYTDEQWKAIQTEETEDAPVTITTADDCPKCGSPMLSEEADGIHCVECGLITVTAKPNGKVNGHAPDLCTKCHKQPTKPASSFCAGCFKRITPEAKRKDARAHRLDLTDTFQPCIECGESALIPAKRCSVCAAKAAHTPTKQVKQSTLEMPEECMYGWLGQYARKLKCPLSAAYPAALAVAAGYGVPTERNVRTNLYVTIVGKTRAGKSVTKDRAVDNWQAPSGAQVIYAYPGSEYGLIQILGGKKAKDMQPEDYYPFPRLLVQDEMRMMFGKIAIQNSALPNALNQMFYDDTFATATKTGGYMECCGRLSILGCLTCDSPDEFADIYGVDTATGLYGRTIFGIVPEGWDFHFDTWETLEDEGTIFRRSKTCKVGAEAYRMADEWVAKDRVGRLDLKELALRVAVVTASINHDDEVTEAGMRAALLFMEWQQRIRLHYQPSEMDSVDGKMQAAILRAMSQYEGWVEWRDLCRNHSLTKGRGRNVTVLNRVKRAMIWEGLIEEEYETDKQGVVTKEKTGRVRLGDGVKPTDKLPTKREQ